MFTQVLRICLIVAVIAGGILLGSKSGDATPISTATANTSVKAPSCDKDSITVDLADKSAPTIVADDQKPIPMVVCSSSACATLCQSKGLYGKCESGTGICRCRPIPRTAP